jgi:putative DNA primase/helicase
VAGQRQSREEAAIRAARIVRETGLSSGIKILTSPAEFANAEDIVDAAQRLGWGEAKVRQFAATAEEFPDDRAGVVPSNSAAGGPKVDATATPQAPFPFNVSDCGVFFIPENGSPIKLAARVDVVAETRDDRGENWGRLLRWKDAEMRDHSWPMPLETLASDSGVVRARLLNGGLPFITTNPRYRERFAEYLQAAPASRRVRCVTRLGWHGDTYVFPDEAIGPEEAEEVLYQTNHDGGNHWNVQGTAAEWRENCGRRCSGNSRLILAVSCGFAGPVLPIVGAESGGIHFHGGTSTGKTTALIVGGSVCGGGGVAGFVQTWRTTMNGLEAIAEAHNDGTLFLDELSQVDPKQAAETAYLLGNGQGKARMMRSLTARTRLRWQLLFMSAGEMTLAEHAACAGARIKGGAEVRLLNVGADAGQQLGLFENLHGSPSADVFALELKGAALKYFGSPFRAFVKRLSQDRNAVEHSVKSIRAAFVARAVPASANGEVRRAAERFALIGAAGELATDWGLTGWLPGEASEAAQRCLEQWLKARGTNGDSDMEAAIRQVRAFLEANGASRFQPLGPAQGDAPAERIFDRVGFTRSNNNGQTEYLILQEAFKSQVCRGFNHRDVLKELDRRGFLVRDHHNMTVKPRLPELGSPRVFCIRAAILEGSDV